MANEPPNFVTPVSLLEQCAAPCQTGRQREISHEDYKAAIVALEEGLKGHGSIYYGEDQLAEKALPVFLKHFDIRRKP